MALCSTSTAHRPAAKRCSSVPETARRDDQRISAGGEVATHERIAQALSVSLSKYVTLSRMIAGSEPISIHESAIASELTG